MDEMDKDLGQKLKQIRVQKGYEVSEVERKLGIHQEQINDIENGNIDSLGDLKKFCNLYDIPVQSLFGREVKMPQVLKDAGVEWVAFGKEIEGDELSPKDIEDILNLVERVRDEDKPSKE